MFFDFLHGSVVDQRPLRRAGLVSRSNLERFDRDGELCGKCIVNTVLNEEAVRTYTGLTGVAILRSDRPFDGRVKVGIVKNDKGSIAPKFERELLHRT